MKGIDAASDVTHALPSLKAHGIEFIARYMSYNTAKNLSPSEAQAISDAGLAIVSVFEARGDVYLNFTAAQGQRDAAQALNLARSCGQPEGTGIYFAVDFDAAPGHVDGGIVNYFDAVRTGLTGKYRLGAYGSGYVIGTLRKRGMIALQWLAQSRGWRGTVGFHGADITQGPPSTIAGISLDTDEAVAECGQWRRGNVVPVARPSEQDIAATIATLQTQLAALGYYHGKIDGIWGGQSARAVQAWEDAG